MIALHAIQTDGVGLPRFAGIIPGDLWLEKKMPLRGASFPSRAV